MQLSYTCLTPILTSSSQTVKAIPLFGSFYTSKASHQWHISLKQIEKKQIVRLIPFISVQKNFFFL